MLEINSAPDRRDLNDVYARAAAEAGVPILIDSDAHGVNTLGIVRWGVATARRAWLTAGPGRQHPAVVGVRPDAQARSRLTSGTTLKPAPERPMHGHAASPSGQDTVLSWRTGAVECRVVAAAGHSCSCARSGAAIPAPPPRGRAR